MAGRRAVLALIFGGGAAVAAARFVPPLFESLPKFEPLPQLPGFRRVAGGSVSSGFNAFMGLDAGEDADDAPRVTADAVRADVCAHLFGDIPTGTVPIASFSDYYCPFCRVQTTRLAELSDDLGPAISVNWHELPLLGEASTLAARAALAAKRQDAYVAFHDRLLSTPFRANDAYLEQLSESIGVDHERLMADIESDSVTRELETSAALSDLFGFVGTPAMVVGRTVIQGEISDRTLRRIIDLERDGAWRQSC